MKAIRDIFRVDWPIVAATAPGQLTHPTVWASTLSPVFDRLVRETKASVAAEVGSWRGGSAIRLAKAVIKSKAEATSEPVLYCIDTWLGGTDHLLSDLPHDAIPRDDFGGSVLYREFLWNVHRAGVSSIVQPIQAPSSVGSMLLRRSGVCLDLAYIDGSHEHDDVFSDLSAFYHLVRPGGIVFGDDVGMPGVQSAVARFLNVEGIERVDIDGQFWIIRKPAA